MVGSGRKQRGGARAWGGGGSDGHKNRWICWWGVGAGGGGGGCLVLSDTRRVTDGKGKWGGGGGVYLSGTFGIVAGFGGFPGVGALVPSFVSGECSRGRGMWGICGKPSKRAIWSAPGLRAVLPTRLRCSSVLDDARVACCLFL